MTLPWAWLYDLFNPGALEPTLSRPEPARPGKGSGDFVPSASWLDLSFLSPAKKSSQDLDFYYAPASKSKPGLPRPTEPSPGTRVGGNECETGFFYTDCEVDYTKIGIAIVGAVFLITVLGSGTKRQSLSVLPLIGEQQYFSRR